MRDLGRLSGTGLTNEDENLCFVVHFEELFPLLGHWKIASGLQDAEVLLGVRIASPRVEIGILCMRCLQRSRLVALKLVEGRGEAIISAVVEVGKVRVAVAVRLETLGILAAVHLDA